MQELPPRPLPESYWIEPGKLLAGPYPRALNSDQLRAKLNRLLTDGFTLFVDLTGPGEKSLSPYAPLLRQEAARLGLKVEHRRMAIPDFDIPSPEQMKQILDMIDQALTTGQGVYVHCFAGIGRTGTVAGCYLVRHGMNGEQALDELVRLRMGTDFQGALAPATPEQRQMVVEWPEAGNEKIENRNEK